MIYICLGALLSSSIIDSSFLVWHTEMSTHPWQTKVMSLSKSSMESSEFTGVAYWSTVRSTGNSKAAASPERPPQWGLTKLHCEACLHFSYSHGSWWCKHRFSCLVENTLSTRPSTSTLSFTFSKIVLNSTHSKLISTNTASTEPLIWAKHCVCIPFQWLYWNRIHTAWLDH